MKARRHGSGYWEIDGSVLVTQPLGVPPDGRTVEADAFVLGTAREFTVGPTYYVHRLLVHRNGECKEIDTDLAAFLFGECVREHKAHKAAIVPLAEPQSEGEAVQSIESPVPSVAESPECGTEKVWLCRDKEGFGICRSRHAPRVMEADHFYIGATGKWIEKDISEETARLIHPNHNLQPGECCEVPAREDRQRVTFGELEKACLAAFKAWDSIVGVTNREAFISLVARTLGITKLATPVPSAPPVAESDGPRWDCVSGETFLVRYGSSDMYLTTNYEGRLATRRVWRDSTDAPWLCDENIDPQVGPDGPAHLAARERARELGLIEAGPRWNVPERAGIEVGEFIGSFGKGDFYVGKAMEADCIVRTGQGFRMGFEYLPGQLVCEESARTCKSWIEEATENAIEMAKEYRTAYDAALSAGQLPPHPRWEKPEGAEVFLGWFEGSVPALLPRHFDGWWRDGTISLATAQGCNEMDVERINGYPGPWRDALARARELRLPERAALQARIATLRKARDMVAADLGAVERELGAIGGVA